MCVSGFCVTVEFGVRSSIRLNPVLHIYTSYTFQCFTKCWEWLVYLKRVGEITTRCVGDVKSRVWKHSWYIPTKEALVAFYQAVWNKPPYPSSSQIRILGFVLFRWNSMATEHYTKKLHILGGIELRFRKLTGRIEPLLQEWTYSGYFPERLTRLGIGWSWFIGVGFIIFDDLENFITCHSVIRHHFCWFALRYSPFRIWQITISFKYRHYVL